MLHKNREEIANLRTNLKHPLENNDVSFSNRLHFDEIALLEKRAEFQALDLAINDRRRHLYHLEMKKKQNYDNTEFDDSKLPDIEVIKLNL